MPNQLLNQCVTVHTRGAILTLTGPEQTPVYYFQVYYSQNATPVTEGTSVELENAGDCRVVAWDDDPGTQLPDFEAPSVVASGYQLSIDGEATLVADGEGDPWPPT